MKKENHVEDSLLWFLAILFTASFSSMGERCSCQKSDREDFQAACEIFKVYEP